MSIFTESETYHSSIFKLDVSTPVKGGPISGALTNPTDGESNAPLQALVDRTAWLKSKLNPIGEVMMWPAAIAPSTDFLLCNGASLTTATYPDLFAVIGYSFGGSGANFNVPDLRGQFVRGWAAGSGTDPEAGTRTAMATGGSTGDNVGSVQDDETKAHGHNLGWDNGSSGNGAIADSPAGQASWGGAPYKATQWSDGTETRPTNAALNFVIRANIT